MLKYKARIWFKTSREGCLQGSKGTLGFRITVSIRGNSAYKPLEDINFPWPLMYILML